MLQLSIQGWYWGCINKWAVNTCLGVRKYATETTVYRIAGNFRGYKISRIVPNLVKIQFSRFLISRSITVTARAYAQL